MKRLVLVRHGQSQWNLENRFTGWTDVDLTPQGVEEAIKAGKAAQKGWIRIYPRLHQLSKACGKDAQ